MNCKELEAHWWAAAAAGRVGWWQRELAMDVYKLLYTCFQLHSVFVGQIS
jgi:hypothetical protein